MIPGDRDRPRHRPDTRLDAGPPLPRRHVGDQGPAVGHYASHDDGRDVDPPRVKRPALDPKDVRIACAYRDGKSRGDIATAHGISLSDVDAAIRAVLRRSWMALGPDAQTY